jgi:hypothetical protein
VKATTSNECYLWKRREASNSTCFAAVISPRRSYGPTRSTVSSQSSSRSISRSRSCKSSDRRSTCVSQHCSILTVVFFRPVSVASILLVAATATFESSSALQVFAAPCSALLSVNVFKTAARLQAVFSISAHAAPYALLRPASPSVAATARFRQHYFQCRLLS